VSNSIENVLPATAQEVEKTVAENTSFRSRTKLAPKHGMTLGLVTRAFDKVRAGVPLEKATFGLVPSEKSYVATLFTEYQEWMKNPAAYTAALDEPTKG
jgi:hypothetical protein